MATEILNNCQFDLTKIKKLYLGNIWDEPNDIPVPIPYKTMVGTTDVIRIEYWADDNSYIYFGGCKLLLNEILFLGENIIFNEELIIDNRAMNYKKILSFSLSALDLSLMTDLKTIALTFVDNGQYSSPPTLAFLTDENDNKICIGYDFQLYLDAMEKVIGEDDLVTLTFICTSKSRARAYEIDNWPSSTPSATPSVTPTITPSITPSLSISATPSLTPTITPSITISETPSITPSISPSITITPSITPSVTPSMSYKIIYVGLDNDVDSLSTVSDITVDGDTLGTKMGFPITPDTFGNGKSPKVPGTYEIVIYFTGTRSVATHIILIDSDSVNHCVDVGTSDTSATFVGCAVNMTADVSAYFYASGSCP